MSRPARGRRTEPSRWGVYHALWLVGRGVTADGLPRERPGE